MNAGIPTLIAVAVVEHHGQYLVGLRSDDLPLAGYCEFPGGKLLSGETPEQAAVRECREETGLAVEPFEAYPPVEHVYAHGAVRLHFIACRLHAGSEVAPRPPFRWVAAPELTQLRFPAANEALVALLAGTSRRATAHGTPHSDASTRGMPHA